MAQHRRQPSRAVIRRRRAVALGGLSGLVGLPLALAAVGGADPSVEHRIAAMLSTGASAPQTLCDHLSPAMLGVVGGHAACVAASPERGPEATVHDVRVSGPTATAIVSSSDGEERVRLVQHDGDWKVDDVS